jgi:uncharacterized protein (UPF0335 family)
MDNKTDLKSIVKEFIDRLEALDLEIDGLKEDRKTLIKDYETRLDTKMMKAAMRVAQIRKNASDKPTLDAYEKILEDL